MRHRLPLFVSLVVVLAACSAPAPVAPEPADVAAPVVVADTAAATRFDAAVDALSTAYFSQVPEAATYNGASESLAPGIYSINLRDTSMWPSYAVATLTYHEAIPGHHMQMVIAIDQKIPLIANALYSNPSGEGWALYSEALAKEMGLYADDPFGDLGRLQAEMHRAVRLVVDTGMHAMKWSREQAVEYMMLNEGAERAGVEAEIERYAAWPGQALGYKLGMLTIQDLRKEAEVELGERFDIRAFHDRLLRVSSFALPVIEADLREWIREEQARGAATTPPARDTRVAGE